MVFTVSFRPMISTSSFTFTIPRSIRPVTAHTTRLKPGHTFEAPERLPDVAAKLKRGNPVARSEEGRWAFLPAPQGRLRLYLAGEEILVAREAVPLAKLLCRARRHSAESILKATRNAPARALLEQLFALGALSFTSRRS